MKRIVKSSLDDYNAIIEKQNQEEARYQRDYKIREDQIQKYNIDNSEASDAVSSYLKDLISPLVTADYLKNMSIDVRLRNFSKDQKNEVIGEIRIKYGLDVNHDHSTPLSWDWSFEVGKFGSEGRVDRETNSWSGMNATTLDDVSVLKQTVAVLEALANLTDEDIIDVMKSHRVYYDDYVTQEVKRADTSGYKLQKLEALVGTDQYIELDHSYGNTDYLNLEASTNKQFRFTIVRLSDPKSYTDAYYPAKLFVLDSRRATKDKVLSMVPNDIKIISESELHNLVDQKNQEYLNEHPELNNQ